VSKPLKVLVFPRDPNPYQELLYAPMRSKGVTVNYLEGPTPSQTLNLLLIPTMLFIRRLQGYRVLHIHWTYSFTLPWNKKLGRIPLQMLAGWCWRKAHLLGYRIVWTAHNVLPHEQLFWNDAAAHRRLGNEADVIICHNAAVREQLEDIGVQNKCIKTIPHGSYVGVYPDTISRSDAREQLHLPADDTVLLFFGIIRPYKGIEQLMEAFTSLNPVQRKNVTLLVAGRPDSSQLLRQLRYEQRKYRNDIKLVLKFIPDDEVQLYFRAADFTVLPYQNSTTSGVAILAFSFNCPIIAPQQMAFMGLPGAAQITYPAGQIADGLCQAIASSAAKRTRMAKAAEEYAEALSWQKIAKRTLAIFEKLQ
jgi:glycosyltransferase involved in cell wall biosynthesis